MTRPTDIIISRMSLTNKGTGAGGANTNITGKKFEDKTDNLSVLLLAGYVKKDYYLYKSFDDKTITYVSQRGLKKYMNTMYNIDIFRNPDEAYIIDYKNGKKVIKILEKKNQRGEGSVETKLWAGPSLKREYEIVLGNNFEVQYSYTVNDFLKQSILSNKKKYEVLNIILQENDICVFFGDDEDYFELLNKWVIS